MSTEEPPLRKNLLLPDVERWPLNSDKPVARLTDVHKSFGSLKVLKGINLDIVPGAITVIIGASGSGKSVLLKHLNGLVRADNGTVELFGEQVARMTHSHLEKTRKRIGSMFQNYALFDSMSVVDNVAFPLIENGAMDRDEAANYATDILNELGLEEALTQFPATLSGGMKKRVSFARAIVTQPELILYDEPTTGLDPIMMEFVDDMILEITKKYRLTGVMISHDLATIFRLADYLAVLHDGEIIAYGPPQEIRALGDERVQRLLSGNDKSSIDISQSAQIDTDDTDAAPEHDNDRSDIIVSIRDVHKSFGKTHVLKGINFEVRKNELAVLIGGSGSGKSVLMKHILGLLRPDKGVVEVFGKELSGFGERKLREMRTKIGMLFQHAALFDSMTVRENIAFPLVERREMTRDAANKRVDELLEKLKLQGIDEAYPRDISNGQQKRVSLARTLASNPELIIYDEPTTGQDPLMAKYVEDMIVEVQETFRLTGIMISHDMASAFRIADTIAMLHRGEIIVQATPQEVLNYDDERVQQFVFAADVSRKKREQESGAQDSDAQDSDA